VRVASLPSILTREAEDRSRKGGGRDGKLTRVWTKDMIAVDFTPYLETLLSEMMSTSFKKK
jgi:hypothetical protein